MNNNRVQFKDKDNYLGLKRILAFLVAIGLWVVSMYFSYEGFAFESTTMLWFGIVLAVTVTVVELVFNTKIAQLNPTLLLAGIVCYTYGVYTNITGFYILQHGNLDNFFTGSNWLIPIFAGIIAEVLPEALFAWGIGAGDAGDLVGNLTQIVSQDDNSSPTQYRTPNDIFGKTNNAPIYPSYQTKPSQQNQYKRNS